MKSAGQRDQDGFYLPRLTKAQKRSASALTGALSRGGFENPTYDYDGRRSEVVFDAEAAMDAGHYEQVTPTTTKKSPPNPPTTQTKEEKVATLASQLSRLPY